MFQGLSVLILTLFLKQFQNKYLILLLEFHLKFCLITILQDGLKSLLTLEKGNMLERHLKGLKEL